MIRKQTLILLAIAFALAGILFVLVMSSSISSKNPVDNSQNAGAYGTKQGLAQTVAKASPDNSELSPTGPGSRGGVETPAKIIPKVEGKAQGALKLFEPREDVKSSLYAHPTPDLWLAFPESQEQSDSALTANKSLAINVQLPSDARQLLRKHWKVACTHYYSAATDKLDRESRIEREKFFLNATAVAFTSLERMTIKDPNGRRLISENEAVELVKLLNTYARDIVLQFYGGDNSKQAAS